MVSTHPAKCGDHRYSGNGDMMFLVVFRLYMSLLNSVITVYLERTWPTMLTQNFRTKTQQVPSVSDEGLLILITHVYNKN